MSANDQQQGDETGLCRRALEDATDLFLVLDPHADRIAYLNPAASQFLSGGVGEPVAVALSAVPQFSSPEGQPLRLADLVTSTVVDVRMHSVQGRSVARARANVFAHQGRQLVGVLGRVSDRYDPEDGAMEEMLQRQRRQSQKMETISQMAGGIAHDFNNILASVLGYAELAQERYGKQCPDKLVHYLQEIQRAGERARDLLGRLMDYSHQEEFEAGQLDLQGFLSATDPLLRSTLTAGMNVRWEIDEDLPTIRVDPQQLRQAVINVCLNARDACDGRGSFTISARSTEVGHAECVSCHRPIGGHWVRLSFEDDGAGIHPADAERVFDPFFTTRRGARRSGLGLSMVHGVVHRAGGHIELASRMGAGTRVDLLFPAEHTGHRLVGGGEVLQPQPPAVALDGLRVMVVDDEPALVELLTDVLCNLGCQVDAYTDSQQALGGFRENPQQIDVLFTDQTMPRLTGTELTAKMRALRPGLPVVLISGDSLRVSEDGLRAQGIQYFLPKPMDLAQVAELLQRIRDDG